MHLNLAQATFMLFLGLAICVAGLAFGLTSYLQLKRLPVHVAMREISDLIFETFKAYLVQQGKFLLVLWAFIGTVIFVYFKFLAGSGWGQVSMILAFSLVGMAGSYGIAWYGIRVNTFANSRTAFAALEGKPYQLHNIPLRSGMSIGMVLISIELFMMLFCPPRSRAPASSASRSVSPWGPRRCASRVAFSPRSPTSAPTS